jgi:4-hydroxy-tetrahydrodipicolinate synthase
MDNSGVYALTLTPYNEDLTIDFSAYEAYIEMQAAQKPRRIFCNCGSSEMALQTAEERLQLASATVKRAGGIEVFATGNLEPTRKAQIAEIHALEEAGCSGIVLVTNGLADDPGALLEEMHTLIDSTVLPVMLYEFPGRRPHILPTDAFAKLAATGRVCAVKDTTCTMLGIEDKIAAAADTPCAVLQANIPFLQDAYISGAQGICGTPTTVAPGLFVRHWEAFAAGKQEESQRLFEKILCLDFALLEGYNVSAKYLARLLALRFPEFRRRAFSAACLRRGGNSLTNAQKRALENWFKFAIDNEILQNFSN